VRGTGEYLPMTAELALKLGAAAGRYFRRDGQQRPPGGDRQGHAAVGLHAGKRADGGADLDGDERAAAGSGADAGGGLPDPVDAGRSGGHDFASHNPAPGQWHQVLWPRRLQAVDAAETEIEALLEGEIDPAQPQNIGRAKRIDDGLGRYVEYAKTTFPVGPAAGRAEGGDRLRQWRRLQGRADVLWELGAEVIPVGVSPNGHQHQ
jgi:phosphoglucosamine mutase